MGVRVPRVPVCIRSPEPFKSSVTGPSLLVNCYLEIKFHKKNQGDFSIEKNILNSLLSKNIFENLKIAELK